MRGSGLFLLVTSWGLLPLVCSSQLAEFLWLSLSLLPYYLVLEPYHTGIPNLLMFFVAKVEIVFSSFELEKLIDRKMR